MKTLHRILKEKLIPIIEIGTDLYATIFGNLRKSLAINGFPANIADEIVLSLINPKRKR